MNVIILTEDISLLQYEIAKIIKLNLHSSKIKIIEAESYISEKSVLSKLYFIISKFRRRGFKFYIQKSIKLFQNFILSRIFLLEKFSTRLSYYGIEVIKVKCHSIEELKNHLIYSDCVVVAGCRKLSKEVCDNCPERSFVYHSCEPRFVKGVTIPGFWETIYGHNTFRLSIIQLKYELDTGEIIYQREFKLFDSSTFIEEIELVTVPMMIVDAIKGHKNVLKWDSNVLPMLKFGITKSDLKLFKERKLERIKSSRVESE